MRISIIAVGKIKEPSLRACIDEYAARIKRYADYEEHEIKESQAKRILENFRKRIPKNATTIALEVHGQHQNSTQFSQWLQKHADHGTRDIAFLIGGAYGLDPIISQEAQLKLSLSQMTLPHRLCRLVLVEQIYRAFSLAKGEPYAHE